MSRRALSREPSSIRGCAESLVPGRLLLPFALDEGPAVVKRNGGVAGVLGEFLTEGEGCRTLAMLGEDATGARVW